MKWILAIVACLCMAAIGGCAISGIFFFNSASRSLASFDGNSLKVNERLDAFGKRLSERDDQLKELIKDGKDSLDANYYELHAQAETTTVITRQVSDFVSDLHAGMIGGKDAHGVAVDGAVPKITALVDSGKKAIDENSAEMVRTLQATNKLVSEATPRIEANLDSLDKNQASLKVLLDGPLTVSMNNLVAFTGNANKFAEDGHASGLILTETMGYVRDSFKPQKQPFWTTVFAKGVFALLPPAYSLLQPSRVHVTNPVTTVNTTPAKP